MFALAVWLHFATIATASRHHAVAAFGLDKVIGVVVAIVAGELHDADAVRIYEFAVGDDGTVGYGVHCRY